MVASRVLRLNRIDSTPEASVLVKVDRQGIDASRLDLRLVGTDGEYPYVGTISSHDLASLRNKGYSGGSDEWRLVLSAILLEDTEVEISPAADGVEAVATVGEQVTIIVRKNIGGITQRLGTITLVKRETEEIELFDWTALAASSSDHLRVNVKSLQESLNSQQDTITNLTAQLDDLVKAKKEHEDELVQKFAELLNTKKLKIRDQQRLLVNAKIDPETASQVQNSRAPVDRRKAGSSRPSKRKAHEEPLASESDEFDHDAETRGNADRNDVRTQTPEQSELDETEDEESDADGFAPAPAASQASRKGLGNKGRALEASQDRHNERDMSEPVAQLPPRRELPFNQKALAVTKPSQKHEGPGTSAPTPKVAEDDEETDDDEL